MREREKDTSGKKVKYGVQSKVCFCIALESKKNKMKGGMMKIENASHDFSIKGVCNELIYVFLR